MMVNFDQIFDSTKYKEFQAHKVLPKKFFTRNKKAKL